MPRADGMVVKGPLLKTWLENQANESTTVKDSSATLILAAPNTVIRLVNMLDCRIIQLAITECDEDCCRANTQMRSLYGVTRNEKIGVLSPSQIPSPQEEMPFFADIIGKTHLTKPFTSNGYKWKIQFVRPHNFGPNSQ